MASVAIEETDVAIAMVGGWPLLHSLIRVHTAPDLSVASSEFVLLATIIQSEAILLAYGSGRETSTSGSRWWISRF